MIPKSEYVGRRVRVIAKGHYKGQAIGRCGVVESFWSCDSIGVRLDGVDNSSSKYGYFYFKISELQFLGPAEAPEKTYEGETEIMEIKNYANIAMAQFLNDRRSPAPLYEYANFDPDLKVGDCCVVMSAHHELGIAEVVDFKATPEQPVVREIVGKFDKAAYDARVSAREKATELKAKMEARAKQLQDLALFQALAQNDAEMAELVQEYLGLMKC